MILRHFMLDVGTQEVNSYLMADEATREGLMVDAGGFDPLILETVAELELRMTHILLTHLHWDHVDALPRYLEQWPEATVIAPAPPPTPAGRPQLVAPGARFGVGPFEFEVIRTSGHTPESVSYYSAGAGVCFVGDALFSGSVGGTQTHEQFEEQLGHL
jgi:glyoxylase-like metal-dependent hydrolase (beta-lactamase superfamily II)